MLDPKRKLFRWGPISACPLFMYFTVEPAFTPLENLFGIGYPESLIIFKDGKVTWLLDEKSFVAQSHKFVQKVVSRDGGGKYLDLWNQRTKTLVQVFEEMDMVNMFNLPKGELLGLYKKFKEIYWDWWVLAISVELVTTSIEPQLGRKLKAYYGKDEDREFNRDFATLTSPLALTFYRQEQKDLLSIYKLPKGKQRDALKKHQAKYFWMFNSYYEGKVLDVNYFKDELAKLNDREYKKISREIDSYEDNIKKRKREILDSRGVDDNTKELIRLVESFAALQDERKMYNFRADHYLELFSREFARGYKKKIEDVKNSLPDELLSIEQMSDDILYARQECWIFECGNSGIKSVVGKDASKMADRYSGAKNIEESMIHGVVASVGPSFHFRGTAKLVLTIGQVNKIEEGDILVTTMTSPDFVIGMKKAGAIITDVGGILSHAAIVSRELGKPCIVGTEIATKVIKDGDVVEIHSGRGTVKIVKSQYGRT